MPVFSFVCEDCNNRFETLVRSNADKPVCDKCGSDKLVKQVSRFAPAVPAQSAGSCPAAGICPSAAPGGCCGGCCGGHN
jgi:putative FmdB family regulatory protein